MMLEMMDNFNDDDEFFANGSAPVSVKAEVEPWPIRDDKMPGWERWDDKAYEAADRIRQDLEARGISLQDGPLGTTFRPCIPVALTQEPAEEPATVA